METPLVLRDYQESIADEAVAIIQKYNIVCFAIEVRCGKTLISLVTAQRFGAKRVLFVTKLKAISSIESDCEKFRPDYKLSVCNYESLHKVYPTDYDFVIIDECHKLGGFPKTSECTKQLKNIVAHRPCILMSGTFTPESFSQIYHILCVSDSSPFKEYPSFYKWAHEFVTVKKKYYYNREINDYSHADKEKIDSLTKHLFISYTQEEAGFEQPVKEVVLKVRMQESTYKLAEYLRKHHVYVGRDGQEILADTAVKMQQKFHQIFSGTIIDESKNGQCFDHTKAKFIKERFAGQKIGIFYKFQAERLMLIWAYGIDRLTEDPQEFNQRDDLVFISQIQSGREGINLSTADALVFLNIDFSAVSYWQARARLQDKNRTKEAVIYWIFSECGLEEKIYERVQQKKDYTLSHFVKDYQIKKQHA